MKTDFLNGAAESLSRADPRLALLIRQVGPCTLRPRRQTPFQALLKCIVYQQLSGAAARKIYGRMLAMLPKRPADQPSAILDLSSIQLRSAGVSRPKAAAIVELAAKAVEGRLPTKRRLHSMDDDSIVGLLTSNRGIGPWTAHMYLIFWLGRPDVFPAADLGVRKGYQLAFGAREPPAVDKIEAAARRWRPYRSVAAWYLWRAVDLKNSGATQVMPFW